MFNFIFDGKIGEILAPVTGTSNKFHLAIQHHRNSEVQNIVSTQTVNLNELSESGIAPIHVACRYNNIHAVEMFLSCGASVNLKDSQGNSPLHYASKYGNFELCKYLVSRNCSALAKNASNQTAYDVAESHSIRQYLLPLQFQDTSGVDDSSSGSGLNYSYPGTGYPAGAGSGVYSSTYPPQPYEYASNGTPAGGVYSAVGPPSLYPPQPHDSQPMYTSPGAPVGGMYSTVGPPSLYPPQPHDSQPMYTSAGAPPATLPTVYKPSGASSGGGAYNPSPTNSQASAGTTSTIGASTSATSGGLNTLSLAQSAPLAPPPIFAPAAPLYATPSTSLAPVEYSTLVPLPPSSAQLGTSVPVASVPSPPPQTTAASSRMIRPDGFHSSSSDPLLQLKYGHVKETVNVGPPPLAPPGGASSYSMYTNSSQAPQPVHSRYVGYDAVSNTPLSYTAPPVHNNMYPPASPPNRSTFVPGPPAQSGANPPNVNIFNPATDCDVVSLNADSSAIL